MGDFLKKYIAIIIIVALYLICGTLSDGYIYDLLNLETINPHELFNLIITSTASIIGIIIAVVLLTFDISKGGFIRSKKHNILNNRTVIYIISLFLSITILTLWSFVEINNFHSVSNLTTGYYLIFLFILFIVSLFPSIKGILETTNSLKRTLDEIKSLKIEHIGEVLNVQFDNFSFNDNSKLLLRIRQQLIIYIRDHDYEAYSNTLQELNKKMLELVGNGENRRRTDGVAEALCFIWESANNEASRVQNIQYFITLWECIEELYTYVASNRIQLMYVQELDFFIGRYTSFLKRNHLIEPLIKGVEVLGNALKQNLRNNCPAQQMLCDLYREYEQNEDMPHYVDESIQWGNIIDFTMDIFGIQIDSIELRDEDLYRKCDFELEQFFHELVHQQYPNLEPYQEAHLIEHLFRIRIENESKALISKTFNLILSTFESESSHIANFAAEEKFYTQSVMKMLSDFIIKLQYEQVLSSYMLNLWAALGRHLSHNYKKNELCSKSFDYVCETIFYLKNYIEQYQSVDQEIYLEIREQLSSLKNWINKDFPKNRFYIKQKIGSALANFKSVDSRVKTDIVKWQ